MLEDSVFESARRRASRNPLTMAYSVLLHVAAMGVLILVSLLQMQAVPIPQLDTLLRPPHFVKTEEIPVITDMPAPRGLTPSADAIIAPTVIPSEIARIVEAPAAVSLDVPQSGRGASIQSIFTEALNKPEATLPLPPKPAEPEPAVIPNDQPIRISEGIQQGNVIRRIVPSYPPLALQARVQGVVVLEAVINKEGTIDSLRVVSGHPLLTRAAIEAVQQWTYRPTLLNGEPVAVVTTITVNFSFR